MGAGCGDVGKVSPLCPPVPVHPCPVLAAPPRGRQVSPDQWDFPVSCISPDIFHFEIRMILKKTCVTLPWPGLASLGELRPGEGEECARGGSALSKLPCTLFWASCGRYSLSYFGISPPPLPFSSPFPLTSSNRLRYFPVFFFPCTQSSMKE